MELSLSPEGRLSNCTHPAQGDGELLLHLASAEYDAVNEGGVVFWRNYARSFLTELCKQRSAALPSYGEVDLAVWMERRAPGRGMEYLTVQVLSRLWESMAEAFARRIEGKAVQEVLAELHPEYRAVGRVTLHLAENLRDDERPFAFLATYVHGLNARGQAEHLPLARALKDSAGNAAALRALLLPLHEGSLRSPVLKELLESKCIYTVLAWSPEQAHAFLLELPEMEAAGLVVKVPDWWQNKRPPSPKINVVLDAGEQTQKLGYHSLLKFRASVALGSEVLSAEELAALQASTAPLVSLKGKWVQPDREQLREALAFWHRAQQAYENGVPFHQGLRWLAGWKAGKSDAETTAVAASVVQAGPQLSEWIAQMQAERLSELPLPSGLRASLRPYQRVGLDWLTHMGRAGAGACLADDMGLGKTLQVIAYLLRRVEEGARGPSLIVAPASLLGNWQRELEKFAPELECRVVHRSAMSVETMQSVADGTHVALKSSAILVTTYTQCSRLAGLLHTQWQVVVLDEAQTIKNASSQAAQTVRQLHAEHRVALSGTPIENRLMDLWSLMEFLNPGLLGSGPDFALRCRELAEQGSYAALRAVVRPFLLRRMKTDPAVAPDLPKKIEVPAYCSLSKRQATLYQRAVNEMLRALKQVEKNADTEQAELTRKGLVLGMLLKLKQICDHPSLFSGDQGYAAEESGKFTRLTELASQMAERQERLLVFTQFREMTEVLVHHLAEVFGRPGLVLHGGTSVARRAELVAEFQREDGPPFFVISLKAGGTGLTLTAANQVIHFDRWWNPAVEDQATDRAYRIGQSRTVLVHKMIARGTLEERIDRLLNDKKKLQNEVLGDEPDGSALKLLTEMNDDELAHFVSLSAEWSGD